ncbi:ABC transporter substrate-binding protein, partial [Escherichia coli]|nr:ABC transporter substrate-binding protein [Escherichia coli]
PNPEQLMLFKRGDLDAVWTVEPSVTRLEQDAGGKIFLDQKEAVTTILVTNNRTLKEHADLVKKFVAAHRELTDWINKN